MKIDPDTAQRQTVELLARRLTGRGLLDNDSAKALSAVVLRLAKKTRYGTRVSINAGCKIGTLNLFFVKKDACDMTRGICAYAGCDCIFCDSGFLTNFLDDIGITRGVSLEKRDRMVNAFQVWVLGHEISHADLSDPGAHFAISFKPRTQADAKISQKREFMADRHFLILAKAEINGDLDEVLIRLFNQQYSKKYGDYSAPVDAILHFDSGRGVVYPYPLDGSHPDWTVRCARLLALGATEPKIKEEAAEFLNHSGASSLLLELIKE